MNQSERTADLIARNRQLLSLAMEARACAQDVRLQTEDTVHRSMMTRLARQGIQQRRRAPLTLPQRPDLP